MCVLRFPLSTTRREIMTGFRAVVERIVRCGIEGELWVNGSFLTEKIDPADIDLCAMIPSRFYDFGTEDQRIVIDWLISSENEPKRRFHCDTNADLVYPETSPDYYLCGPMFDHWRRIFGTSVKTSEPKGIAVLRLEQVSQ